MRLLRVAPLDHGGRMAARFPVRRPPGATSCPSFTGWPGLDNAMVWSWPFIPLPASAGNRGSAKGGNRPQAGIWSSWRQRLQWVEARSIMTCTLHREGARKLPLGGWLEDNRRARKRLRNWDVRRRQRVVQKPGGRHPPNHIVIPRGARFACQPVRSHSNGWSRKPRICRGRLKRLPWKRLLHSA
jgi:hypothetical protein